MKIGINISVIDESTSAATMGPIDITNDLLLEDGSFMLLEDGSKILLEG